MNSSADLSAVLTSVDQARGLPNAHYTDQSMFEVERQQVLFDNWSGVGFGKDIPSPGDAKPVTFMGVPLLLVRDKNKQINVFQNTCRHRGMILVEKAGPIKGAIRCPYHSWCYGLDGALKATPHVGGPGHNLHDDIRRDELGLARIRSHVWRDVIFVNINGQADEFEQAHSDLISRWSEFEQPCFSGSGNSSFRLEVNCNWKLAVENYCESYHLPWVHPGLNAYSRLEDHYNIEMPGQYSGQGTLVYQQLKSDTGNSTFPDFDALGSQWDSGAEYVALYPNVLFGVHRDHCFAIVLEPASMDKTIEHIELYYAHHPEQRPDLSVMRETNAARWKEVFVEDVFVVEGMQRGRHGPAFDGGKFSPVMDGPTHNFHHWVASQLTAN